MKNILLTGLHRIVSAPEHKALNFNASVDKFEQYQYMLEISISSYQKYLAGDWEWINLCEEFDHIQDAFRYTMNKTHKLWHQEPCNILFVDPDTYCIKPTEIFGKRFAACCEGNCGVRYFPHDMKPALWLKAKEAMTRWNYQQWDYEQYIYAEVMKAPLENGERYVSDIVKQRYGVGRVTDKLRLRHMKSLSPYSIVHLHSTGYTGQFDYPVSIMEYLRDHA